MMPILLFPGDMIPGVFGPIMQQSLSLRNDFTLIISNVGIPSVMQTIHLIPAAADSITASAAKKAGTKIAEALAPCFSTASATELKTGTPRWFVPPLPGVTPATTAVPYSCMR